jgi:hypothetical protein
MRTMMKNILKGGYAKLFVALLSFSAGLEARVVTNVPTAVPAKQPVPVKVTPIKAVVPKPAIQTDPTRHDPEILDINKSVKIINNQHDCDASKWNNNQDDACQCCLSYGKGRFGKEQSADQIIDHCVNKSKQCNSSSLTNIKRKHNAQAMSSDDFLTTVYKNTTVVNKMNFDPALLGPNGTLTENLLSTILVQAYNEGKLTDKDFSKKECLNVKKIGSVSGYNTLQFFFVNSTCMSPNKVSYVVKESKKGLEESTNLQKIEEYPGMKDILAPKIVKRFPTIALPFFYFSYHPHHQNIHYIATMPAADGIVLYDLLTEFRDNQTTANTERVKKTYWVLGEELSNFHKKFMKPVPGKKLGVTVAHGDFHPHNIFYDEKREHCTFIDNETMVRSFEKLKTPKVDFRRLILTPFTTNDTVLKFKELLKGVKPSTYLNITLRPFIKGYISAYRPDERKQLLHDLREIFTTTTTLKPWKLDPQYSSRYVKDYINPIFDEIEKTLTK